MNNVFCFHGSDHKVGVSQLSQCVAEYIALEYPDKSVMLVHSDGCCGENYSIGIGESMDHIRPYLADRLINIDELKTRSHWKNNLYIIGGAKNPESGFSLNPDMSEFLLKEIAPEFDVVICDSGAEINYGMALGTLFAADFIYLVISQTESSVNRYEWQRTLYRNLALNIDRFIVNRYDRGSLYSKSYIAERLNCQANGLLCVRSHKKGFESETDKKSLLFYRDPQFRKDIGIIAEDMLCRIS